jgi:hypothetical protein
MPYDLNPGDIAAIRARLGPLLTELHQTMLDVDVAPIFLFSDQRPRLVEARTRAVHILDGWAAEEPQAVAAIYARLPEILQNPSGAESLLEAVTSADYFDLPIDLFRNPVPDSRVFAAAPTLVPLLDESGLVTVAGLDARPWGLHFGKHAFQYHQLLRRGYQSGIHYELIGTVLRLAEQHDLIARFALDERRLRYKDEYEEFFEKDYWFGRSLSDDDLDSLAAVGETFHGDPNGGTSWLHPYAGLSIRWTADGPLKGVEIEEFMPPPKPGDEWVLARYLHALRDTTKKTFVHCDGAVKAFGAPSYPRTQQDFRARGKGDHYRKLFRVDGEFPASVWSALACSWFRGNSLILEYFDVAP